MQIGLLEIFMCNRMRRTKKTKARVSSEAEPPSKKQKKGKKQKEVKINEGETAVVEEEESAKEKGRSEAVLLNIVAHLEKLDRKFDSRLTEYDTKFGDFSRGLLDTIGDTVKTTVDESLRVLGVSNSSQPEGQHVMVSEDNQQPESNSGQPDGQNVMVSEDNRQPDSNSGQPASKTPIDKQPEDSQPQKTPDKGQSEKNLADDIAKADAKGMGAKLNSKVVRDKAAGVKKNLDSAFGNADATNADLVSDSPGKRNNLAADLERNEAELKKKQKQEEAELKRKKKQEEAELKKKQKKEEAELEKKKKQEEADLKKKKKQEEADSKKDIPASKRTRSGTIRIPIPTKQIKNTKYSDELWPESDVEEDERKRCGRIKEYRLKAVQLSPDGSQISAEFGPSVPFSNIGDNVTTCMRKGLEPSPAIYDPLGPVDPVKRDNLLQHLKHTRKFHMEKLTRILSSTESSSLQDLGPSKNMDGWFKIILLRILESSFKGPNKIPAHSGPSALPL
ncbi:unnamed protein product [Brassica rapa subsp. trilocularis]